MPDSKARFIQYLKERSLKWSRQREHLFDLFAGADGHVTADELYALAVKDFPEIGYATVYRTLRLLSESGLATAARFGHKSARYENTLSHRHHDHMVCTRCGSISEFSSAQIERLQDAVARDNKFTVTHHKMVLYGVCRKCAQKKQ
jgi:Fur family transcriptional regulator, ferric uptake regulator